MSQKAVVKRGNNVRCRKTGFTLIELLVVIAIIALLLSILMPALRLAKKKAKQVVCQSNLKQWGYAMYLYTNDNKGHFWVQRNPPYTQLWMKVLRPYYPPEKGYCCPSANKPSGGFGARTKAWGPLSGDTVIWAGEPGQTIFGSYEVNGWIMDLYGGGTNEYFWRTVNNGKDARNIPMLADGMWVDGFPTELDDPPQVENYMNLVNGLEDNMQRYCIDRHNGGVNAVFMDFSVQKVGLKGLWRLKWNRQFDTRRAAPVWPEWMKIFPDEP